MGALPPPESRDITGRLRESLRPGHLALLRLVADEAAGRGLPLYIIGGFVRDLLLGRHPTDLDLVVEGDAIALARRLAAKHGGQVTAHKRFGTAQWALPESLVSPDPRCSILDLISTRSETYASPGALPTVKSGSISDDLHRRDFTINTLALRLDGEHFGELHEEPGALADLQAGIVRVLRPDSYRDDPTRILRAVRYEQRYGFRIAPEDEKLISAAKSHLAGLSGERLRHELDLILAEEKPAACLARLDGLAVLAAIHPSLGWDGSLSRAFEHLDQPEPETWKDIGDLPGLPRRVALGYLLWLGELTPAEIKDLASRLALTADLREALLACAALRADLPSLAGARPSAVTARLDRVPSLALCAISLQLKSVSVRLSASESVDQYLSRWRHVRPKTTGRDLLARGLPPGPVYQAILRRLREAWLDGEVTSDEEENALLEKLIRAI